MDMQITLTGRVYVRGLLARADRPDLAEPETKSQMKSGDVIFYFRPEGPFNCYVWDGKKRRNFWLGCFLLDEQRTVFARGRSWLLGELVNFAKTLKGQQVVRGRSTYKLTSNPWTVYWKERFDLLAAVNPKPKRDPDLKPSHQPGRKTKSGSSRTTPDADQLKLFAL
jgi:hypothetical protein